MLPVFSKPLEAVTPDDIQLLITEAYPEDATVEFKEKLPHKQGDDPWYQGRDSSDYARNQLLEEVIAFANAYGGTLLLGIQETKGRPARAAGITPLPRCGEFAERLRLQIRDCVDPQIPLVHAWGVVTDNQGGGVVIVRVPKSRLAPHRHTATLHCYVRRADRSEKMTMREIQDLTLQTERGMQNVDRIFQERSRHFCQWITNSQELKPHAARATVVPLDTLYAENIYRNIALFPYIDSKLQLEIEGRRHPLEMFFAQGERPILRGTRRMGKNDRGVTIQELHWDGVGEILLLLDSDQIPKLPLGVLLSMAINSFLMADAFRKGVGAPDIEYAFEMELIRPKADICLRLLPSGWPIENDNIVTPNPCIFPRLSVGPREEFPTVIRAIANDLLNAAGEPATTQTFTLIYPS
jgi:schlafen family protein